MSRKQPADAGFSAAELAIVMAVILVIAAIAVPHLLHARVKANEASAVASMKAIQLAEAVYQNTYPDRGYSASLANLGSNGSTCESTSATNACLLDPSLASGYKSGYLFDLLGDGKIPDAAYTLTATPQSSNAGDCAYFMNQSGAIQTTVPASSSGRQANGTPGGMSSSCSD